VSTTPTVRKRRAEAKPARKGATARRVVQAKIVRLVPRRLLERVTRAQHGQASGGCHKCGSHFIEVEPAFVHCRYCGSLSRIRGASLLAQEEYELRSGLRLAS
jgi:DNA-directed RNA polymerase subunit RPC12/RpoP